MKGGCEGGEGELRLRFERAKNEGATIIEQVQTKGEGGSKF